MNKRIEELAEQAGFSNWVIYPSKETMSDTPELLEKFAELIVRECMELVEGYTKQRTHTTFYKAEEQIKQHFGVEE